MQDYEIYWIARPHLEEPRYAELVTQFSSWVTNFGGEIVHQDVIGMREMAQVLGGYSNGYYVYTKFKGIPTTLNEINRQLGVSEDIFRHLLVKLEPSKVVKRLEKKPKRRPKEVQRTDVR